MRSLVCSNKKCMFTGDTGEKRTAKSFGEVQLEKLVSKASLFPPVLMLFLRLAMSIFMAILILTAEAKRS